LRSDGRASIDQHDKETVWKPRVSTVRLTICSSAPTSYGGIFDYAGKSEQLEEINLQLESPDVWNNPEHAQKLNKDRAALVKVIETIDHTTQQLSDAADLIVMAAEEEDAETLETVTQDVAKVSRLVEQLEFQRMFSGEVDANPCFVEIQAGSGGTEAQDWAEMLLRMYLRWFEARGWKHELIEVSAGDVAGIKSATVRVVGEYAYGWCRTENGVHRLVRKSPFDSGNRRHTSFAAVSVSPEIDDDIEIDINPADLRIDVYRASGAGGQHVNRTESAVRITHNPSGIVVQCQNDRSQHKNKDFAMKQLRAKLYERELDARRADAQSLEDAKSDIGWGSQIRSYVLDQSRIKDLRTGVETGNTQAVLDGDLDPFVTAALKQGVEGPATTASG